MKNELKTSQAVHLGGKKVADMTGKAVYSTPELRVYGAVSKLTQGNSGGAVDVGTPTKVKSERRVKENIVKVGVHPLGIGLYLFDYLPEYREQWGHGRRFGVMADEVETVMPAAVSIHADGYKQVDYGLLGISHILH